MKTIYEELKEAGVSLESHESDLYVPVSDLSTKILEHYEHKENVKRFKANDGRIWYDIPFAFKPWWDKRASK